MPIPSTTPSFSRRVLAWHAQHGRKHLPWQQNLSPYRVWVSEIMLQQTQVSTVIPYFKRFMQRFPDIYSLAEADIDEVLHLWTGLGYYARGRNLHKCAQTLVSGYQGEFPQSVEELSNLPGIGRSTAGAIASISMSIPAAILDGNVKRVLTRHFAIEGWTGSSKVEKQLWQLAEELTPNATTNKNTGTYTQAMMDLGATLCTRSKPQCDICPIKASCLGLKTGNPTQFPTPKPKKVKPVKSTALLLILTPDKQLYLEQQPSEGIWGSLWCPPQAETSEQSLEKLQTLFPNSKATRQLLPAFRHTFSHYHLDIQPVLLELASTPYEIKESGSTAGLWYNLEQPPEVGLPAPIKKLIKALRKDAKPALNYALSLG